MTSVIDLTQIVLIDLSLAGDNALVVGLAVAALPRRQRRHALTAGIAAAAVLRILMSLFAVQLLRVTGMLVAGGILLLWVASKMYRELRGQQAEEGGAKRETAERKLFWAIWQIMIADVSMSLDNVLAVAGVARDTVALIGGLGLSVALMALASSQIARLAARYPQIVYLGIAIVFYNAVKMIYAGTQELLHPIHAFV